MSAGAETSKPPVKRGRRWLLAWLVLLGIPAGYEWGLKLNVESNAASRANARRRRPPFGEAPLYPHAAHDRTTRVTQGAQPAVGFTLWPQRENNSVTTSWPTGKFELTLTLVGPGGGKRAPASWTGTIDAAWHAGMLPFERVQVSLDALAGRELEAGDYRLIIEVSDAGGAEAGGPATNYMPIRVQRPWSLGDPGVRPPEERRALRFVGFESGKWSDSMILEFTNDSDEAATVFGRLLLDKASPPRADGEARDGDRIAASVSFLTVGFEPPRREGSWFMAWMAPAAGVALVPVPPGAKVTLLANMDFAAPGDGCIAAYGERVLLRTPVGRLRRDDVSTTGPVLLLPRPPGAPRPRWTFEVLEAPGVSSP